MAPCVVDQSAAKLAVVNHEHMLAGYSDLTGDHIIRERAGSTGEGHVPCLRHLAQGLAHRCEIFGKHGGPMRFWGPRDALAYRRQETDGSGLKGRRLALALRCKQAADLRVELLCLCVHRLILCAGRANEGTKRSESHVLVQAQLSRGARDHRHVVALSERDPHRGSEEPHKGRGASIRFLHREKPELHRAAARREIAVDVRELAVQREGAHEPHRDHRDDPVAIAPHDVPILRLPLVDQSPFGIRGMLRDFLDERLVVEPTNLIEVVRSFGRAEGERGAPSRRDEGHRRAPVRAEWKHRAKFIDNSKTRGRTR